MESQDTPGTRWLNEHNAVYTLCPFHLEQGSDQSITKQASDKLGLDENRLLKTLLFIENTKTPNPFLVVLQGTKRVDKALVKEARGLRRQPMLAPADIAHGITGYVFGGTSPFGTIVPNLPVILDQDVTDIKEKVYINAGSTTLMACMDVAEIIRLLSPQIAQVSM